MIEGTNAARSIDRDTLARIKAIQTQLLDERRRYESPWKDVAKYVNQSLVDWTEGAPNASGAGFADMKEVYDSTAISASNMLSDGIQGYAIGRNNAWFRFAFESEKLGQNYSAGQWLQSGEDHIYKQLNRSSFYDEARSFVRCGADMGTAIMFRTDNPVAGLPTFKTLHIKRCLIAENEYGEADTLFRQFFLTAVEARDQFGDKALPRQIADALRTNDSKTMFEFWHIIFPKGKWGIEIAQAKPYTSVYVAALDWDHALALGGYEIRPFYIWRWARSPDGSAWGVDSPGLRCISDIRQANSIRKDIMRISQRMGQPPIKATQGMEGRINLAPHAQNFLGPGEDFAPVGVDGNPSFMMQDLMTIQQRIKEEYHSDFFLILTMNVERQKTATEVSALQGEKAALLSAFFGRLAAEFIEPLLEDVFYNEYTAGRLTPAPASAQEKPFKIDLVSPLAQMQKRHLSMNGTKEGIMEIATLAQLDPNVMDNLDLDAYARIAGDSFNMDKRVLRSPEDIKRARLARAQAAAAQQQQQLAMQGQMNGADIMQKLSKAPEPGSPAEELMAATKGNQQMVGQ